MTRPTYEPGEETARERIVKAFWEMLDDMSFADITVRSLARRAHVNHNTFYRHFDGLEQMAAEIFDESLALDIPAGLLSATGMPLNGLRVDPSDLNKAFLYARSGSEFLRRIVRASLMNAWLEVVGIEASTLTQEQIIDCDIIFGGIVSAMGNPAVEFDANSMARLAARPLGQGMLATMRGLLPTVNSF